MCHKMLAVVKMVECSSSYIVRNYYFFLGFTWDEGGGITFGDQEAVRSNCRISDKEPDFIIHVAWFISWSFAGD